MPKSLLQLVKGLASVPDTKHALSEVAFMLEQSKASEAHDEALEVLPQ